MLMFAVSFLALWQISKGASKSAKRETILESVADRIGRVSVAVLVHRQGYLIERAASLPRLFLRVGANGRLSLEAWDRRRPGSGALPGRLAPTARLPRRGAGRRDCQGDAPAQSRHRHKLVQPVRAHAADRRRHRRKIGLDDRLEKREELAPEGDPGKLLAALALEPKSTNVLLVGHEPYLSRLLSEMVSGGSGLGVDLKKGGLARLKIIGPLGLKQCAILKWLIPARLLVRIGH